MRNGSPTFATFGTVAGSNGAMRPASFICSDTLMPARVRSKSPLFCESWAICWAWPLRPPGEFFTDAPGYLAAKSSNSVGPYQSG